MFIRILLMSVIIVGMQAAEEGIHIAPWKGDRAAAYSLTFDDGWKGQVANTTEIIDAVGLKGTFFLMPLAMEAKRPGLLSWEDAKALQASGHEIGTHAVTKPKLHECDDAKRADIVNGGRRLITEKTGIAPVSFALPGGSEMSEAVKATVYEQHAFVRKPPTYAAITENVGYGAVGKRTWNHAREQAQVEAAIAAGHWRVAMIHAIVKGYSPFPSKEAFKTWCEWIKAQEDRLWTAPMGTVGRYIAAREAATLTVIEQGSGGCRFTLSLPEEQRALCSEALTVVVPGGAPGASAVDADGNALPLTVAEGKLLIDVPPAGSTVTVTW